jgi:hypothetical protein
MIAVEKLVKDPSVLLVSEGLAACGRSLKRSKNAL